MKSFLKKRWHAIPIGIITAVLLACLIAGSAFAAYTVWQKDLSATVVESIEVTNHQGGDPSIQYPGFPEFLTPGQSCGSGPERYIVHNMGTVDTDITITLTKLSNAELDQFEWIGLSAVCSNSAYEYGPLFFVPVEDGVIWDSHGTALQEISFTIGTVDYPNGHSGIDSAHVLIFVDGVAANDADPNVPIDFTVTVSRS